MQNKNSIAYALFETWRINYESGEPKPPIKMELREMTKDKANQSAMELFRYVFDYLQINPLELTNVMSQHYLTELRLNNVFLEFLIFPPEYSTKRFSYSDRINYLARLLYPDSFNPVVCSEEYIWLTEYMKCEQCKANNVKSRITLTGDTVRDKHKIEFLLNYYIKNNPIAGVDNDVKKMYDYFASPKAKTYISKTMLAKCIEALFDSPLEALHYAMPECQRSEFLYNYELFKLSEGK